jgi:hypothetical protein
MIWIAFSLIMSLPSGVRTIEATSCEIIDVRLSPGMSTILQFDEEPNLTFHADDQHFIVKADPTAKRSLAIIPNIKEQEVRRLFNSDSDSWPSSKAIAEALDKAYQTNLFVFFKSQNRLLFRLRFVDKSAADYVLRIRQIYRKGCNA